MAMKIAILGYSGCGKSTLARQLGERYGLPVLHLDSVHWLPGWVEKDRALEGQEVQAFLDSHDKEGWVIDGNYSRSMLLERRCAEADQIIILELSPLVCLWRVLRRWRTWGGQTRPDMGEGCPEKVDWEFVQWVLYKGRGEKTRQRHEDLARRYPEKTRRIHTRRQQKALLKELGLR